MNSLCIPPSWLGALLWCCLQALLPLHRSHYPRRTESILRAPRFLGEVRHQLVLQLADADAAFWGDRSEIELLDHDEYLGQSRSTVRQDALPWRAGAIAPLEKIAEMFLEARNLSRNVTEGYALFLRGTLERLLRMYEAFVREGDPKEKVGKGDRVSSPLARFVSARTSRGRLDASGPLSLGDIEILSHPVETLRMESEQSPNESLKGRLPRIRFSNRENLDSATRQLQSSVNGRLAVRNNIMVALLFLEVSMMVRRGVALDVYTREVFYFRISGSRTPSGAKSLLQEILPAALARSGSSRWIGSV